MEAEAIAELGKRRGLVISTGGGAVLRADKRSHLRMNGVVAYVSARSTGAGRRKAPAHSKGCRRRAAHLRGHGGFYRAYDGTLAGCVQRVLRDLMKFVINGLNLEYAGRVEPAVYGLKTCPADFGVESRSCAGEDITVMCFQSNMRARLWITSKARFSGDVS